MESGVLRSGDTIASVHHSRGLQPMCLGEDDTKSPIGDSGLKLFKIRVSDREGRQRSANVLVERRYAWRGYQIDANRTESRNGATFSAFDGDMVVATISVGIDTQSGMFVEALFAKEVSVFRAPGRRICEFTKLAVDEALRSKQVLASIFHIAFIYARRIHACSDLFVEVNPRHVRFYERMLGFRSFGPERSTRGWERPRSCFISISPMPRPKSRSSVANRNSPRKSVRSTRISIRRATRLDSERDCARSVE